MQRKTPHHFLHFTKKEKNGTIAILFLIAVMTAAPYIYAWLITKDPPVLPEETADQLIQQADSSQETINYNDRSYTGRKRGYKSRNNESLSDRPPAKLFYFDPNTLDAEGWEKLGVNEKAIGSIQKYISKGGRFRKPDDIKKIWSIPTVTAERLLPFVRIESDQSYAGYHRTETERPVFNKKIHMAPIDINTADSAAFESLPGIGPALSRRIIIFRNRLGGFHSIGQVAETFGLPDSTFQKIKDRLVIQSPAINKILLNQVTLDELKQHPYIRYKLANAIIAYRNQHGPYKSPEDLKKLMLMDDSTYLKLWPYVQIGQAD